MLLDYLLGTPSGMGALVMGGGAQAAQSPGQQGAQSSSGWGLPLGSSPWPRLDLPDDEDEDLTEEERIAALLAIVAATVS